jgi:hypothetical protein
MAISFTLTLPMGSCNLIFLYGRELEIDVDESVRESWQGLLPCLFICLYSSFLVQCNVALGRFVCHIGESSLVHSSPELAGWNNYEYIYKE